MSAYHVQTLTLKFPHPHHGLGQLILVVNKSVIGSCQLETLAPFRNRFLPSLPGFPTDRVQNRQYEIHSIHFM